MPPWGGPEGSPPRQGAPNLLLSIVPRRYDTSHHAGGPTQSATGSSASSIRVGRESNSVWGESSGCSRTTNLFTSSTRLVSQQASPPAFVRIPAVRRSAAAAQGMPTTGAFLFRSGSGAGSVDSLPNPLLLPDNASPIFDKPSLSRHCAASASVFPHSRRPINLTWDAYDRHPAFLPFRCLRDGDVSIDTLLNTPLSVEHPLTFPAKPSPLRHRAVSTSVFSQCADLLLLHLGRLRVTTGALLFRSGPGVVSVNSLPNPLLLLDSSSPIFDKPSPSRHRAASTSAFSQCADLLLLHLGRLRVTTGALLSRSGPGVVSVNSLPNPLLLLDNASPLFAKPSPLRPCAASKGAFTQTVAAALFNIWNPAREHSSWLLVAKPQCNSIQFNSIQLYYYTSILLYSCQAVAIATSITSAVR